MKSLATIGVYGFDQRSFLEALEGAGVGLLLDVRQRRGVRGSEYSWANSVRLQTALAAAGISYAHRAELAPTTELRRLQYSEDALQGVGKRTRVELAPAYRTRYASEILAHADLDAVLALMPEDRASALMCVERDPQACHRSLVAQRMSERFGLQVVHLVPE